MKKLIFLGFLFLLTGCFCYKGPVSEFGHVRKDIKPENFVVDKSIYNSIDTTAIYELIGIIYLDELNPWDNNKHDKSYLKFYANGKVSLYSGLKLDSDNFLYNQDYSIIRNEFDPAKSRMGYFYKRKDKILSNISFLKHQCNLFILQSEVTIKNDTLIQSHIGPPYEKSKYVFIKKNIPVELIEGWQPDW